LRRFASDGSGVVVGEPGVGKSHELGLLAGELDRRRKAAYYIPIHMHAVESEADLARSLGLGCSLWKWLADMSADRGDAHGLLVLDGFDSARAEKERQFYLSLAARTSRQLPGWHVLVSVRRYDASRSPSLLDLFPETPGAKSSHDYSLEGTRCRHFYIPSLTEAEIAATVRGNQAMQQAYNGASSEFRLLLRIPFNLWLLEKLSLSGVSQLKGVNSAVQLLNLYWRYRIDEGPRSNDRRAILAKLTTAMVKEKSLSISKNALYEHDRDSDWTKLHSDEVLESDPRDRRVSYRHAILFDYAVSRLLIDADPVKLESFILEDPARPVFLRPSLVFHLTGLWHEDISGFWRVFWHMLSSEDARLRLLARLLPTSVVLNETREARDVSPLLDRMAVADELGRQGFFRLVQAYDAFNTSSGGHELQGREEVWIRVADQVAGLGDALDTRTVRAATIIASDIAARAERCEDAKLRRTCGVVGRNLLAWVLDQVPSRRREIDSLCAVWILPIVLKTFSLARKDSRTLVRHILGLLNEDGFPIEYFRVLAEYAERIWPVDPELVAEIYERTFLHPELSEQKTQFVPSSVIPMSSTRRQDFHLVQFILAERYHKYVAAAPLVATRMLLEILNQVILDEHVVSELREGASFQETEPEEFNFHGGKARLIPDVSFIWDVSPYPAEHLKMADALFRYLGRFPDPKPPVKRLNRILELFRDHAEVAFLWRRLLEAGAQHPKAYARRLFGLCLARPILRCSDTVRELGSFIESSASLWTRGEMREVEEAILGLPDGAADSETEHLEDRRDRLLARIRKERLKTEKGRILRKRLEQSGVPDNRPLVSMSTHVGEITDERWVRLRGAEPDKPDNSRLLILGKPLSVWAREWHNRKPNKEARERIMPNVQEAYRALKADSAADAPVKGTVWTHVASACEAIARADDLSDEEFQFCRCVLLEAAGLHARLKSPEDDAKHDFHGWGTTPQSEAALGLISLATTKPDLAMLSAVRRLATELHVEVRYPTVHYLGLLYGQSRDFFWSLVEGIVGSEQARVVLSALPSVLWAAAASEPNRTADVLALMEQKFPATVLGIEPDDQFVRAIAWLALSKQNPKAHKMMDSWVEDPLNKAPFFAPATLAVMEFVTPKLASDDGRKKMVEEAIGWLLRAVQTASAELVKLRRDSIGEPDEAQQILYRQLYAVFDQIVSRVFFSSGIFEHGREDEGPVTPAQLDKFHKTVKPVLVSILECTSPAAGEILLAPIAHYFMQYLNGVLRCDPADVLHMAAQVIANSTRAGYNLDSLAVREVVKLAEAVLADHRDIAQGGRGLEDLISLLDAFASAGWPDANRLVWKLDEVFR
jgi:hypothetical protein